MSRIEKSLQIGYSAEQMYALVNDIESYPEFLPWCKQATVHYKQADELKASLVLAKGPLQRSLTTLNRMQPNQRIDMNYVDGPFKHCRGCWQFLPKADGQCQIDFHLEYEFNNKLAAFSLEPVFKPIASTLVDAFYERAKAIYTS